MTWSRKYIEVWERSGQENTAAVTNETNIDSVQIKVVSSINNNNDDVDKTPEDEVQVSYKDQAEEQRAYFKTLGADIADERSDKTVDDVKDQAEEQEADIKTLGADIADERSDKGLEDDLTNINAVGDAYDVDNLTHCQCDMFKLQLEVNNEVYLW